MTSPNDLTPHRFTAPFWSVFRIVIALLFTLHGLGTVLGVGNDAAPAGQWQALLPTQNDGVSPALYAWAFLAIAVLGAGPWALDALVRRPAAARTAPAPA